MLASAVHMRFITATSLCRLSRASTAFSTSKHVVASSANAAAAQSSQSQSQEAHTHPHPPSYAHSPFAALGLHPGLVEGLALEHSITEPTSVQRAVLPRALAGESLILAAATGSGKTMAYTLPVLQRLVQQEAQDGFRRRPKKPRALVLVPTRELAVQVLAAVKSMSHRDGCRVASCALLGGEQYSAQKTRLAAPRGIDVVVATPGRLLQHCDKGHASLGDVTAGAFCLYWVHCLCCLCCLYLHIHSHSRTH